MIDPLDPEVFGPVILRQIDQAAGRKLWQASPEAIPAAQSLTLAPDSRYQGRIARLTVGDDGIPIGYVNASSIDATTSVLPFPRGNLFGGDILLFSMSSQSRKATESTVFCISGDDAYRAYRRTGTIRFAAFHRGQIASLWEHRLSGSPAADAARERMCDWFEAFATLRVLPGSDDRLVIHEVAASIARSTDFWVRDRTRFEWYFTFTNGAAGFARSHAESRDTVLADIEAGKLDALPGMKAVATTIARGMTDTFAYMTAFRSLAHSPDLARSRYEQTMFGIKLTGGKRDAPIPMAPATLFTAVMGTNVALLSDDSTDEGSNFATPSWDYSKVETFKVEDLGQKKAPDQPGFWLSVPSTLPDGAAAWLNKGGRLLSIPELEDAWDGWTNDWDERESSGDLAFDLLDEACACKQATIPDRATVQIAFGPFTGCDVIERDDRVLFRWHSPSGHLFLTVWPDRRHFDGHLIAGRSSEETLQIIDTLHVLCAGIIRDFWVVEDRDIAFATGASHHARRKDRGGQRIIYLPRIRQVRPINSERLARIKSALNWDEREKHWVRGHPRRAEHPSEKQLALAKAEGKVLDPGYTWVRGHDRGTGETAAPIYRSRSALQLLWG